MIWTPWRFVLLNKIHGVPAVRVVLDHNGSTSQDLTVIFLKMDLASRVLSLFPKICVQNSKGLIFVLCQNFDHHMMKMLDHFFFF